MTRAENDVHADWVRSIGVPPAEVNFWGIQRKMSDGKWRHERFPDAQGTQAREWPLEELSLETIRERWGTGEFRVSWHAINLDAGSLKDKFRPKGTGRTFVLTEPQRVQAPIEDEAEPRRAEPQLPEGFASLVALMNFTEERANKSLQQIVSVARELGGRGSGIDPAMVQLLLGQQEQNASLRAALDAQRVSSEQQTAALRHELGALRAQLLARDSGDDDDDSPVSTVAKAAAPLFRPGKPIGEGLKAAVANYVAENPGQVIELLKAVPTAIAAISQMQKPEQAPPPPQQQAPQLVPQSRVRPAAKPAAAKPSGVNAYFAQKAEEEARAKAEEAKKAQTEQSVETKEESAAE